MKWSSKMIRRSILVLLCAGIFFVYALPPSEIFAGDSGILYPRQNAIASGTIDIQGAASHPSFRKWQIDLVLDGDRDSATFVALGDEPVDGPGTLATLDTALYPDGDHELRLRVVHSNLNYDEYFAPIRISNVGAGNGRQIQTASKPPAEPSIFASDSTSPPSVASTSAKSAKEAIPQRTTNPHTLATRLDIPFDKTGRWIEVDLATQTLRAWEGDALYLETLISSGKEWTPTVQGVFQVNRKVPSQRMVGPDYDLPNVQAVMYFFSNYAIHGAYWHENFGEPVSHGCVNMREDEAVSLFDWAPMGTPVVVYE